MIQGTFTETPTDHHVLLRADMLGGGGDLSSPTVNAIVVSGDRFPDGIATEARAAVERDGIALVSLGQPVEVDRFLTFGRYFGTAMSERDPAVQPFVQDDVVLNLLSEGRCTSDSSLQPFASNELNIHSESSGRALTEQPRYIALLCVDPGEDARQSQTILISMADVDDRLTADERAILTQTRYSRNPNAPPLLRSLDGRPVFSFRDFGKAELDWTYFGDTADADAVKKALRALLAAIYGSNAIGMQWAAGDLALIDNMRFFHGRTRGVIDPSSPPRHLMRLRLV